MRAELAAVSTSLARRSVSQPYAQVSAVRAHNCGEGVLLRSDPGEVVRRRGMIPVRVLGIHIIRKPTRCRMRPISGNESRGRVHAEPLAKRNSDFSEMKVPSCRARGSSVVLCVAMQHCLARSLHIQPSDSQPLRPPAALYRRVIQISGAGGRSYRRQRLDDDKGSHKNVLADHAGRRASSRAQLSHLLNQIIVSCGHQRLLWMPAAFCH